jgi:hypothetical protein
MQIASYLCSTVAPNKRIEPSVIPTSRPFLQLFRIPASMSRSHIDFPVPSFLGPEVEMRACVSRTLHSLAQAVDAMGFSCQQLSLRKARSCKAYLDASPYCDFWFRSGTTIDSGNIVPDTRICAARSSRNSQYGAVHDHTGQAYQAMQFVEHLHSVQTRDSFCGGNCDCWLCHPSSFFGVEE